MSDKLESRTEVERGFTHFYRAHLKLVRTAVRSILLGVDEGVVDDEVQNVMIKLWGALFRDGIGRPMVSRNGFIWNTAKNAAVDAFRKNRSWRGFLSRFMAEPSEVQESFPEELMEAIFRVLPDLPSHYQEILKLYYCDGLSHKLIAERLGVNVTRNVEPSIPSKESSAEGFK